MRYPCNQCEYKATQQGHLNTHIQSKHDGVKYPCNQCEYQFSYNSDLKKHQRFKHYYN